MAIAVVLNRFYTAIAERIKTVIKDTVNCFDVSGRSPCRLTQASTKLFLLPPHLHNASQIMRLVEEAQSSRSRYQVLADKTAYWLTLIAIAAALETSSEHPLAKAVVEAAERRHLNLPQMRDFKTVTGRGAEGNVNGITDQIGRPEWVKEQSLQMPSSLQTGLERSDERGESAVVLMN